MANISINSNEWFKKYLLPVLISVVFTGLMTLFITYTIDYIKEQNELNKLKINIAYEIGNIYVQMEELKKMTPENFYAIHLIYSNSFENNYYKLNETLPMQDLTDLGFIYRNCKNLDNVNDLYFQAALNKNEIYTSALGKRYIETINSKSFNESLSHVPTIAKNLGAEITKVN